MDWAKWSSRKLGVLIITLGIIYELAKMQAPSTWGWMVVVAASVYMLANAIKGK